MVETRRGTNIPQKSLLRQSVVGIRIKIKTLHKKRINNLPHRVDNSSKELTLLSLLSFWSPSWIGRPFSDLTVRLCTSSKLGIKYFCWWGWWHFIYKYGKTKKTTHTTFHLKASPGREGFPLPTYLRCISCVLGFPVSSNIFSRTYYPTEGVSYLVFVLNKTSSFFFLCSASSSWQPAWGASVLHHRVLCNRMCNLPLQWLFMHDDGQFEHLCRHDLDCLGKSTQIHRLSSPRCRRKQCRARCFQQWRNVQDFSGW